MKANSNEELTKRLWELHAMFMNKSVEEREKVIMSIVEGHKNGKTDISLAFVLAGTIDPRNFTKTIKNKYPEFRQQLSDFLRFTRRRSREKLLQKSPDIIN